MLFRAKSLKFTPKNEEKRENEQKSPFVSRETRILEKKWCFYTILISRVAEACFEQNTPNILQDIQKNMKVSRETII